MIWVDYWVDWLGLGILIGMILMAILLKLSKPK